MFEEHELSRISFIAVRDGLSAAREYSKFLKQIYITSIQSSRKKTGRRHPFRIEYLKSAYSARHIHRTFDKYFHIDV